MNNSSSKNNTFCYDLPIAVGNSTFCGLTEKWSPRFSHGKLLAMAITPVLMYWIILCLMVKKLLRVCSGAWYEDIKQNIDKATELHRLDGVKYLSEGEKFKEEDNEEEASRCCRLICKRCIKISRNTFSTLKHSYQYGCILRAKS